MNKLSGTLRQSEEQQEYFFGPCRLMREPTLMRQYESNGLDRAPIPIRGVVRPKTTGEVSHVLRAAYQQKIPVYPISRGRNWGYGASAPIQRDCIILDLSHMNRIINIDTQLGTVEIEPGVSQGQLFEALKGTDLMMDVTGAGPEASIVGNVLERGFGHTPLGFRSQHFVISEIVLGDGTILPLTWGGNKECIGRIGLSAGFHELLQQSNFAVITRMHVMLMRRPEECLRCILQLDDDQLIVPYIDSMRMLKEEGVFDGLPHIANDMRLISMHTQFDFLNWDSSKGIAEDTLSKLRHQYGIARWTLACGIYGSRIVARAKAKRVVQVLSKIGRVKVIPGLRMNQLRSFAQLMNGRVGNIFGLKLTE